MLTSRMKRRARPEVETLEARLTPSVSLEGVIIMISGTDHADIVSVREVGPIYGDPGGGAPDHPQYEVDFNFHKTYYEIDDVAGINFKGRGGGDIFHNDTSLISYAKGGHGVDLLTGGSKTDILRGGPDGEDPQHDFLWGRGGPDFF